MEKDGREANLQLPFVRLENEDWNRRRTPMTPLSLESYGAACADRNVNVVYLLNFGRMVS
jgi:hypothetical protein